MHESAREEFTNIRVTRDSRGGSRWFTGPKEIINYKVISYFKQNLFRDEKGIYIYQTFREFSEKGYITVAGPLLEVFRIAGEKIIFDSLDELAVADAKIVMNTDDEAPYVYHPRLRCYAGLPAGVVPYFSELLLEDGDGFTFCGKPVLVEQISRWS